MEGRLRAPGCEVVQERPPLAYPAAVRAMAGCVGATVWLVWRRRLHLPSRRVGMRLRFADGTSAWVFRETVADRGATVDPSVLVVVFRLRAVRGRGHSAFRRESLLNTSLFAGFPGFVSKLWLADDERGRYRGVYEWDGPRLAENYARALWRVLALVSVRGSIHYVVLPGLRRDVLLARLGCRPCLLPRHRSRHERRHPGCGQPGLEAGVRGGPARRRAPARLV